MTALFLCTAAFAGGVEGKWTGRTIFDEKAILAQAKDAKQKEQIKAGLKQAASFRFALVFKANKTFVLTTPPTGAMGSRTVEGSWSVKGATVTMTTLKKDGKAVDKALQKPQPLTLSKDGKTMTMTNATPLGTVRVVFSR